MMVQAIDETAELEAAAKEYDDEIETAVEAEDYAAAATARKNMDRIFQRDTVGTLIEVCPTLLQ